VQYLNKNNKMTISQKIILASKSPRRKKILDLIGLDFIIHPSNIDEHSNIDLSPIDFAKYWSKKKAKSISIKNKNDLIIGADTIVNLNDKILGKPKSKEESYNMLKELSGKTHSVITGITIVHEHKGLIKTFSELTKVHVRNIPNKEILYYINNYPTQDKSGSYGIQDWFSVWIKKIDGCYYNVMGLPLSKFYKNYIQLTKYID
tara:strand:+ start:213 stop:824 length:612 start_codon:yes stop_codon:yes gene_type:complete